MCKAIADRQHTVVTLPVYTDNTTNTQYKVSYRDSPAGS